MCKSDSVDLVIVSACEVFLRALHPKWRQSQRQVEESERLNLTYYLYELIENLKFYKISTKKESKIVQSKGEKENPLALKSKKESSDRSARTAGSKRRRITPMADLIDFKKFLQEEVVRFREKTNLRMTKSFP
ncbi:hypothetical protein Tco_1555991 [Tanacetum coccineum]